MNEYTFTMTQQEAQLVFNALGQLPLKTTVAVYTRLQQQVIAQDAARATADQKDSA